MGINHYRREHGRTSRESFEWSFFSDGIPLNTTVKLLRLRHTSVQDKPKKDESPLKRQTKVILRKRILYIRIKLSCRKWQVHNSGQGITSSTQFPLESKHPIQFRYVPVLRHEPEGDCNWQPLDSWLDLNIDKTETWQKGLCSTLWLTSRYTDPFYCQINSLSGLQYVRAVMPLSIRPQRRSTSIQTDVHSKATRHALNQQGQKYTTSKSRSILK